jgi:hypothetical protein
MSIEFYKVLHLIGIFTVLLSLGGMCLHVISGGTRDYTGRKWAGLWHGVGLLLILIAGFGLLAKEGLMQGGQLPGWVVGKLVIWLILGGIPVLIYRQPKFAKLFWFLILAFGGVAVWLVLYKPF